MVCCDDDSYLYTVSTARKNSSVYNLAVPKCTAQLVSLATPSNHCEKEGLVNARTMCCSGNMILSCPITTRHVDHVTLRTRVKHCTCSKSVRLHERVDQSTDPSFIYD